MPDASTRRIQSESGSRAVLALPVVFLRTFPASYSIRNVTTFSLRSSRSLLPKSTSLWGNLTFNFRKILPVSTRLQLMHGSRSDSGALFLVNGRLLQYNSILKTVSCTRPTRQGFRNSRIMWGRADEAPEFTPL